MAIRNLLYVYICLDLNSKVSEKLAKFKEIFKILFKQISLDFSFKSRELSNILQAQLFLLTTGRTSLSIQNDFFPKLTQISETA